MKYTTIKYNGDCYFGQVNCHNVPHGKGKLVNNAGMGFCYWS